MSVLRMKTTIERKFARAAFRMVCAEDGKRATALQGSEERDFAMPRPHPLPSLAVCVPTILRWLRSCGQYPSGRLTQAVDRANNPGEHRPRQRSLGHLEDGVAAHGPPVERRS